MIFCCCFTFARDELWLCDSTNMLEMSVCTCRLLLARQSEAAVYEVAPAWEKN